MSVIRSLRAFIVKSRWVEIKFFMFKELNTIKRKAGVEHWAEIPQLFAPIYMMLLLHHLTAANCGKNGGEGENVLWIVWSAMTAALFFLFPVFTSVWMKKRMFSPSKAHSDQSRKSLRRKKVVCGVRVAAEIKLPEDEKRFFLCPPRLSASNYLHTQKDQKLSFLHRLTADTQRFGYSLSWDRSTMTSNGTFFIWRPKSRTKKEQRQITNFREFFIRKLPVIENLLEAAGEINSKRNYVNSLKFFARDSIYCLPAHNSWKLRKTEKNKTRIIILSWNITNHSESKSWGWKWCLALPFVLSIFYSMIAFLLAVREEPPHSLLMIYESWNLFIMLTWARKYRRQRGKNWIPWVNLFPSELPFVPAVGEYQVFKPKESQQWRKYDGDKKSISMARRSKLSENNAGTWRI